MVRVHTEDPHERKKNRNGMPDAQRKDHGSDAYGSAQKPAGDQYQYLDACTNPADRLTRTPLDARHQTIPRTWPKICGEIKPAT